MVTEVLPEGCFLDPRHHYIDKDPSAWRSMTKQSFRDESDINKIVASFMKTGVLPTRGGQPFYGDVSDIGDYQSCMNKVIEAQELFAQMDASIRERFDNDPGKMLDFLENPGNLDEAVKLGMVVKRPVEPVEAPKPT